MTNDIKKTLGEYTEQLENKAQELSPLYTNLEPYQRGILILVLIAFLIFVIYQLTKSEPKMNAKKEAQLEDKMLRQMAFFKRLRE